MAYSEEDLITIEKAIAQGVLTVKFKDRLVTYRSLSEMIQIKNTIQSSIDSASGKGFVKVNPKFSKGL